MEAFLTKKQISHINKYYKFRQRSDDINYINYLDYEFELYLDNINLKLNNIHYPKQLYDFINRDVFFPKYEICYVCLKGVANYFEVYFDEENASIMCEKCANPLEFERSDIDYKKIENY